MNETGNEAWILKKSYEIAYAVFRIAATIDPSFAGHMKNAAMSLLGTAASENYRDTAKSLSALRYFTRFAMDVNMMGINNGEILLREIERLDTVLRESHEQNEQKNKIARQSGPVTKTEEVDLSEIFTEKSLSDLPDENGKMNRQKSTADSLAKAIRQETAFEKEVGKEIEKESRSEFSNNGSSNGELGNESGKTGESGNGILKSAIRQSAILERIRQIGNCRIKDIEDILPDSSERTIRYDLQTLAEQNLIERIGSGGPSVFYRIRQEA